MTRRSLLFRQTGISLIEWELGLCWLFGFLIGCVNYYRSTSALEKWTATSLLSLTLAYYTTITALTICLREDMRKIGPFYTLITPESSDFEDTVFLYPVYSAAARAYCGALYWLRILFGNSRRHLLLVTPCNSDHPLSGLKSTAKALLIFTCGALGYFLILEERATFEGFVIGMTPLCFNVWLSLVWLRLSFHPDGLSALLQNPVFASMERMGYCQNRLPNFTALFLCLFNFWEAEAVKIDSKPYDPLSKPLDCYESGPPILLWNPVHAVKECMDYLENLVLLSWVFGLLLVPAYDLSMNHTNELSKWKSAGIVMLLTFAYYTSFLGGWFLVQRLCSMVCRKKFGPLCIALSILILTACFSVYALGVDVSDVIVTLPQGFSLWLSLMWAWLRFYGIPRISSGHESTTTEIQV